MPFFIIYYNLKIVNAKKTVPVFSAEDQGPFSVLIVILI